MILIAELEGKRSETLAALISRRLGVETRCIHSARELVQNVNFGECDLILLNPKLPDLGNRCFDLIKKIRTQFNPLALPIVLMAGKDWSEIEVEGFRAGVNDVLHPPLEELSMMARLGHQVHLNFIYKEALNKARPTLASQLAQSQPEMDLNKPIPCELPLSLVTKARSYFCKTIWMSYNRVLLRVFEDVPRQENYQLEFPKPGGGNMVLEATQTNREATGKNMAGVFNLGLEITKAGDGFRELFENIYKQHQAQAAIVKNEGKKQPDPVSGTVMFSPQDVALSLIKGSRYEFRKYLGRGSFASVYLVDDLALKRPVAMKVLSPDFSKTTETRQNFLNEAQIAAQFHHPNIVFVFEVGELAEKNYSRHLKFPDEILKKHPERMIYFTMQYVEGQSLSHWIGGRQHAEPACVEILIKIARAMNFAHSKDVIHRDIKPDNIMITQEEEVLVADFGIATVVRTNEAAKEKVEIACTPKYASPEQLTGEHADQRSDLYSFGIVAYELLSGKPPFTGQSIVEIAQKQLTQLAPPLHLQRVGISPKLAEIIGKCMEKKPANRFQKAEELLSALLAFKGSKEKVQVGNAIDAVDALLSQAIVATSPEQAAEVLERIIAFVTLRQTQEDVEELRKIYQKFTEPNLINILIERNLNEDNLQLLYQFFMLLESSSAVTRILRWFQKETQPKRKEFLGSLAILCAGEDLMPLIAYGLELGDSDARILLRSFGETASHVNQPIFLKWALHSGYQTQKELIKIISTTKREDFEVLGILDYYSSGKGTIHKEIKALATDLMAERNTY